MKVNELKRIQNETKNKLIDDINLKECLKDNTFVKQYLEVRDNIQYQEIYQQFLEKLEIGEDGTVFSFFNPYHDRAHKNTHFGLSKCLKYAFYCLESSLEADVIFCEITLYQLLEYLENASNILTDMNYCVGDRKVSNDYGLEVYLNPKNYSVVDGKMIPLTNEKLHLNYDVGDIRIVNGDFIKPKLEIKENNFLENMTPREVNAFFGKEARRILGVLPVKEKVKLKKFN